MTKSNKYNKIFNTPRIVLWISRDRNCETKGSYRWISPLRVNYLTFLVWTTWTYIIWNHVRRGNACISLSWGDVCIKVCWNYSCRVPAINIYNPINDSNFPIKNTVDYSWTTDRDNIWIPQISVKSICVAATFCTTWCRCCCNLILFYSQKTHCCISTQISRYIRGFSYWLVSHYPSRKVVLSC